MGTPHNTAKLGDIAKVVLMPGDPLRAKFIAETFLEDYTCFNTVRNMFGFTGTYKGKKVSVMGSGMGMPSIGIYSYELFKFYDVEAIIRIGSAGGYDADLKLFDVILANGAYSESTYALVQSGYDKDVIEPNAQLNELIVNTAKELEIPLHLGLIHSSDVFYRENPDTSKILAKGCKAVEMESFALFNNAKVLNKKAACLLTISDSFYYKQETTPQERQESFTKMMEIALNAAIKL